MTGGAGRPAGVHTAAAHVARYNLADRPSLISSSPGDDSFTSSISLPRPVRHFTGMAAFEECIKGGVSNFAFA